MTVHIKYHHLRNGAKRMPYQQAKFEDNENKNVLLNFLKSKITQQKKTTISEISSALTLARNPSTYPWS